MASRKRKGRLPSQIKYDQSHPTVSCRLPGRYHARLMALLGEESFASWVMRHLKNDEARVNARVEQLADKRDNLGATIFRLQRQAEALDRQVEQRRQEVTSPIEQERERLRQQLHIWYQQQKAAYESRLERFRAEESEVKDRARKAKMEVIFLENRKQALERERQQFDEEREAWKKQAQQATEFINRCPSLFCRQCPGAWFNQLLGKMMSTAASLLLEDKGGPNTLQLGQAQRDGSDLLPGNKLEVRLSGED